MRRLRWQDVKGPIARACNLDPDEARTLDIGNEVQERLMVKGNWLGTVMRYEICVASSCLTWPRQIATILGYALGCTTGTIRDQYYEMSPSGPGLQKECCGSPSNLIDDGTACTFDDIWDMTSNVGVQCDVHEAAGSVITIQGYNQNAQWIRTQVGGLWIDGFQLPLSTTMQVSPMLVSKVTGVSLPVPRNGVCRLWQINAGNVIKPLGFYEPDEDVPQYRRSKIPSLPLVPSPVGNSSGCGCGGKSTTTVVAASCCCKKLTVMAKLRHIPVAQDADWLILQNLAAFKLGAQAILKEDRNLWQEAQAYWAQAIQQLEDELMDYYGDANVSILSFQDISLTAGAVENDICYGLPAH